MMRFWLVCWILFGHLVAFWQVCVFAGWLIVVRDVLGVCTVCHSYVVFGSGDLVWSEILFYWLQSRIV